VRKANKIKGILYDLDGVLVDACDWHYHSLNRALKEVVGFEISRDDHISTYNGLPTTKKLKMMGIVNDKAINVWKKKQKYTIDVINEMAHNSPQKRRLHEFTKMLNIKSCCVTNSIRETAELMLKNTGQLEYMEFVVSNEDVEKNKPNPECYMLAMSKLKLLPNECLIVEDSPKGIESAEATKAHVLKVDNSTQVHFNNIKQKLMGILKI
tara:strand:+ start:758 stop:1387 length:630 start_codon:yes stop_codon:yes gene_type:complete